MNRKLYPIFWKDKWWFKKDCGPMFKMIYTERFVLGALGYECGIYFTEGMVFFPDDSVIHTK
jgi:hypothetical protein